MEALVIPLVLALMLAVKQCPIFAPEPPPDGPRRNGWLLPWIAAVLGVIGTFLYASAFGLEQTIGMKILNGVIFGLAAAGLWDGGINQVAKAIRPGATSVLLLFICILPFLGGCMNPGHFEMLGLVSEGLGVVGDLRTGGQEYSAAIEKGLTADSDRNENAWLMTIAGLMADANAGKFNKVDAEGKLDPTATTAAMQMAILEKLNKYNTTKDNIATSQKNLGDLNNKYKDNVDALEEALAGLGSIETERGLLSDKRDALIEKARTGEMLRLFKKGP